MRRIYIIGSLRNPAVPIVGERLRRDGHYVFDDWYAAGPEADDYWQKYEKGRGRTYAQALNGLAVRNVFRFDQHNLDASDTVVLVMPAGKSGHLELGYAMGRGCDGYVLFDKEPERWDAMYRFCRDVFFDVEELADSLG
jgi:hypothetical protein